MCAYHIEDAPKKSCWRDADRKRWTVIGYYTYQGEQMIQVGATTDARQRKEFTLADFFNSLERIP